MLGKGGDVMIRAAIADDEQYWIDKINEHVLNYSVHCDIEIQTEKFLSCEALLTEYLRGSKFDIIFLDIEFKNYENNAMNGIDFGKKLRELFRDASTAVVYITSFKQYAIDSIKIRPFDFLEKPVTYEQISGVITQCVSDFEKGKKVFRFLSDKVESSIIVSNIRYFESDRRKVKIHTVNNVYEFYGKLSDIMNQKCLEDFICIHKSFLVNMNYIEKFTSNSVILYGTEAVELPISKNKKQMVSEKLLRR